MKQADLALHGPHELRLLRDGDPTECSARPAAAALVDTLGVLAVAASSRLPDGRLEEERLMLLQSTLRAARAASAALQMWAAQCLSEYRGSRTTWDVHATSELLASTLAEFESSARDSALRLAELIPEVGFEQLEAWQESPPLDASERHQVSAASGGKGAS